MRSLHFSHWPSWSALLEQNEKNLDQKLGNVSGWQERGDGAKGDKRGEQTQERRRGGAERRGGIRGEYLLLSHLCFRRSMMFRIRWCTGRQRCALRARSRQPDGRDTEESLSSIFSPVVYMHFLFYAVEVVTEFNCIMPSRCSVALNVTVYLIAMRLRSSRRILIMNRHCLLSPLPRRRQWTHVLLSSLIAPASHSDRSLHQYYYQRSVVCAVKWWSYLLHQPRNLLESRISTVQP